MGKFKEDREVKRIDHVDDYTFPPGSFVPGRQKIELALSKKKNKKNQRAPTDKIFKFNGVEMY